MDWCVGALARMLFASLIVAAGLPDERSELPRQRNNSPTHQRNNYQSNQATARR